jgi:hypothetical protein
VLHEPRVGYDAARHLDYIGFLARGALPVGPDFFDPPLYFVVPALIRAVGTRLAVAAKGAQYLNVLCSLGVTYTLVRLAELARPGDMLFKTIALGLLGMLPVYYKTFAFVRPEPMLAALAALATWQAARLALGIRLDLRRAALLGLVCGLLALTRQQGLLVVVAAVIFVGVAHLPPAGREGGLCRDLRGRHDGARRQRLVLWPPVSRIWYARRDQPNAALAGVDQQAPRVLPRRRPGGRVP